MGKSLKRNLTWEALITAANNSCGVIMTGNRTFTIVDEDVMQLVGGVRWKQDGRGYVKRNTGPAAKRKVEYLHRLILCAPPELEIDHRNNTPSDNRRSNLRLATHLQQKGNLRQRSKNGFKGVRQQPGRIKWEAKANHAGKTVYLGSFTTPEEAARAYDVWAKAKWGDFAKLNFPDMDRDSSAVDLLMSGWRP